MKYGDLVLLKDRPLVVFMAPKFSFLKAEDDVIIRDAHGIEKMEKVEDVLSVSIQSDEYKFILELSGQDEPFRICKRMHYQEFDYSDFEDGDADG